MNDIIYSVILWSSIALAVGLVIGFIVYKLRRKL
jgi:hypothetical protein